MLLIALGYWLAARLSNQLSAPPIYASSLWLPAGLGLIAALHCGGTGLLGVLLGALLTNSFELTAVGGSQGLAELLHALPIAVGATGEAWLAARLLRGLRIWPDPPGGWRLVLGMLLVALLAGLFSATVGTLTLALRGTLAAGQGPTTGLTWWLGDVAGMLLLLPSAYWPGSAGAETRKAFLYNLLLPSLLAVGLAIYAFLALLATDRQRQQDNLAAEAHHLQDELRNGGARALATMRALGAYVESEPELTLSQFTRFANALRALGNSVQALQWAPRLDGEADLRSYRQLLARENLGALVLHPVPGTLDWQPRTTLVPITYMVPMAGNQPAFGLDLWSEPRRRQTLEAAWRGNEVAASPPLELVQRPGAALGYLLDKAVWRDNPEVPLHGYVQGVFTAEQLAESALEQTRDRNLHWSLVDLAAPEQTLLDVGAPAAQGIWALPVQQLDVDVAGRSWRLRVSATPAFLAHTRSLNLWAAQLGLMLVASAWGLFLFAQWVQNQRLARLGEALRGKNQELSLSQRLFESVAEAAPTAIFRSNREGQLVYANPAYDLINGPEWRALDAERMAQRIHPEDRDELMRGREQALQDGTAFRQIYRLITADRGERWLLTQANPVRDIDGAFDGHIGSMTDITTLKRSELALQRLNQAPTQDREQFLRYVTQALAQLFGSDIAFISEYRSAAHDRCRSLAFLLNGQFQAPADYDLRGTPCAAVAREDVLVIPAQAQQAFPDDPRLPALGIQAYAAATLRNPQGEVMGYLGIMRRHPLEGIDAAAILNLFRLRIAAELERWSHLDQRQALLNSLEERVQARTLELRQSAALAEQASRAKSDFLATMSHEIRTPMNSSLGLLELLLRQPLAQEQRSMLESVQDAGRSLLRLIDDMLDLSQIEAGAMRLEPEATSLQDLLARLDDLYRQTAEAKALGFQTRLDPDLAEAYWVDRLRLRQILANLLANAIKFTDRGSVSLRLRKLARQDGVDQLEFRVEDSGIGVAPEQLARLFQPFQRVPGEQGRSRGGSGLGLSISRRLAEQMGGSLEMQSELGRGSCLILRLPLRPTRAPAESSAGAPASATSVAEAPKPRVLAAEDHAASRLLIGRQLKELGYDCELAKDGEQAWRLWQQHRHPVVITDYNMPGLDGLGLARRIREAETSEAAGPRTLILACTADLTSAGEHADLGPFDRLLSKPLNLRTLEQTLKQSPASITPPLASKSPMSRRQVAVNQLAELCGGDRAAAESLMQDFAHSLSEDLARLQQALADDDSEHSQQALHRLKGALSALGDQALLEQISATYGAAKQGALTEVRTRLSGCLAAFEELTAVIPS